jgi:hypothetical protein
MPRIRSLSFREDKSLFGNPDRGLAIQMQDSGDTELPYEFDVYLDYFAGFRDDYGTTTIVPAYYLGDWKRRPLPDSFLERLDADFDAARENGYKIAPRFQYATDFSFPYSGAEAEKDAPAGRIIGHLEQMAPVLKANADVLSFAIFGMIGPYGEQWNSFHGNVDISGVTASGKTEANGRTDAIFDAMLDALPEDRMMTVRYPSLKQSFLAEEDGVLDTATLDRDAAWTGSDRARIGFNNDSSLNPNFPEKDRAPEDLAYLAEEGRYVVGIGFPDAQAGTGIGLPNNEGSLTPRQMREGIYDGDWDLFGSPPHELLGLELDDPRVRDVIRDMGYRLRLTDGEIETRERAGETLSLSLDVANEGSGSLFNPRDVAVVFRHIRTGETFTHEVVADDRGNLTYFPHPGETRSWDIDVPVPEDAAAGRYHVLLHLPDPHPRIADRPDYAIRLANEGWEPETGMNLIATVRIRPGEAGAARNLSDGSDALILRPARPDGIPLAPDDEGRVATLHAAGRGGAWSDMPALPYDADASAWGSVVEDNALLC